MTTYAVVTQTGHVRHTTTDRSEALRVADAYMRADRILHTIRPVAS